MIKECSMIHRKMQKTDINCYQSCALHYQVINSTRPGSVSDDDSFNWKTFVIVVFCVGVLCISIVVIVYVKKKHRKAGPIQDVPKNS